MKRLLLAFQFLTVFPVKVKGDVSENDLVSSTAFFPAAGAFQGLVLAGTALGGTKIFQPEVVAGLVISVYLLMSGGFDMDGLMDTFDALAVRSTGDEERDREKRLSVMKDSTVGAMGAMAMAMVLLLKFLLLNSLFHTVPLDTAVSLLFLMPVFSKWVTVPAMYHGIPARRDGLGRIFLDRVGLAHVFVSTLVLSIFCLASAALYLYKAYAVGSIEMLITLSLSLYLLSLIAARFFLRKFGGLTGDNFGALSEISEILYLLEISVWLRPSI